MTETEKKVASMLIELKTGPNEWEARFISQLPSWYNRDMTYHGRKKMIDIMKRCIPDHQEILNTLIDEELKRLS